MLVFFLLLIVTFCFFPPVEGRADLQAFCGLIFLSILLGKELWKKIHWSVGISTSLLLISGIYSFYFPKMYPIPVDIYIMAVKSKSEVLFSIIGIIFFSSILLIKDRKFFEKVLTCLFIGALVDSLCLVFNYFILNQSPPFAMLNNGTADAAFIACMLPVTFESSRRSALPFMALMVVAIIICRSNTGLACLGISVASWLFINKSFQKWILLMVPWMILIFLDAHLFLGPHFMGDSGRYNIWRLIWNSFKQYGNPIFGFGTGNFTVWGDAFQRYLHMNDTGKYPVWYWLHNEPLEILFENGVIGVVSVALVYISMLIRLYARRNVAFSVALVYGFTGLTEMPLRLWVTQILGVCLLSVAFSDVPRNQEAFENHL